MRRGRYIWRTGTGTGRRCCGGAGKTAAWHGRLTVPTGITARRPAGLCATNRDVGIDKWFPFFMASCCSGVAWLASWQGSRDAASAPRTRLTRLRRDRDEDDDGGGAGHVFDVDGVLDSRTHTGRNRTKRTSLLHYTQKPCARMTRSEASAPPLAPICAAKVRGEKIA